MMDVRLNFSHLKPLVDPEGNECCGFLIADGQAIIDVWPVPSLAPSPVTYSIGRAAWIAARRRARAEGVRIAGSIHTHPNGPAGPSELDLQIAKRLRPGEVRAVWHLRTSRLTLYDRSGILAVTTIAQPWWLRLLAPLLFC